MREILFRGKRLDNGAWVEGDRVEQNNPEYHDYIITEFAADVDNRHIDILTCDIYEVDSSTVGRYTGLTDKNGKKVFEGDIVKFGNNRTHFEIRWIDKYARFAGWKPDVVMGVFCIENSEAIGNIHDNPDLLK